MNSRNSGRKPSKQRKLSSESERSDETQQTLCSVYDSKKSGGHSPVSVPDDEKTQYERTGSKAPPAKCKIRHKSKLRWKVPSNKRNLESNKYKNSDSRTSTGDETESSTKEKEDKKNRKSVQRTEKSNAETPVKPKKPEKEPEPEPRVAAPPAAPSMYMAPSYLQQSPNIDSYFSPRPQPMAYSAANTTSFYAPPTRAVPAESDEHRGSDKDKEHEKKNEKKATKPNEKADQKERKKSDDDKKLDNEDAEAKKKPKQKKKLKKKSKQRKEVFADVQKEGEERPPSALTSTYLPITPRGCRPPYGR